MDDCSNKKVDDLIDLHEERHAFLHCNRGILQ